MKHVALGFLLFVAGCLDYEVEVKTVVLKDGSAQRSVRIHERTDKHKTWRRYGQPQAPYALTGDDAKGFEARAAFGPGSHSSGVRYVLEALEDEYKPDESKGKPVREGRFSVGADDLLIGTLYHYREDIDVGIDAVYFRANLRSVVQLGADVLVTALEIAEPTRDFKSVRANARFTVVPRVTKAIEAIHSQLQLMEAKGNPIVFLRTVDDLMANPQAKVILAELALLGIRRRPDAPKTNDLEKYFDIKSWTLREGVWKTLLAPLPGINDALREKLWNDLTADDGKNGEEGAAEKRKSEIWKEATDRVFPESREKAMEQALRKIAAAVFGVPLANDLFDKHQVDVAVQLPGRVISTNGLIEDGGRVSWRVSPNAGVLSNPSLRAWSFVPSAAMVGRIVHFDALLEYRRLVAEATEEEREGVRQFLKRARESGLDAAAKIYKSNKLASALVDALAPAR